VLKSPVQITRQFPQRSRYCRFYRQGMRADCSVRVGIGRSFCRGSQAMALHGGRQRCPAIFKIRFNFGPVGTVHLTAMRRKQS
jgi:hypothetical protein